MQWLNALHNGKIGAVEQLEFHLSHRNEHHAKVNAVMARDIEGAMAAARASDNISKGDRGRCKVPAQPGHEPIEGDG